VIPEGGKAGKDQPTGRLRPFCRHALTNIPDGVMMPP
jgi:hypothetical protein